MGCSGSKDQSSPTHNERHRNSLLPMGTQANLVKLHKNVKSLKKFYKIGQKLGEGSFGSVRLATCLQTGRKVAIKTINKSLSEQNAQLATEIELLRQIEHPNIVRLCKTAIIKYTHANDGVFSVFR
jgi:serine/threonine protein kinase